MHHLAALFLSIQRDLEALNAICSQLDPLYNFRIFDLRGWDDERGAGTRVNK